MPRVSGSIVAMKAETVPADDAGLFWGRGDMHMTSRGCASSCRLVKLQIAGVKQS